MRNLVSGMLSAMVFLIAMTSQVLAAEYQMDKMNINTFISGDVPLEKNHLTIVLYHDWNNVGGKNTSDIYSYLFYMMKIGDTEFGPGLGVANSPTTGKVSGILSGITYGQVSVFRHYSEIDLYIDSQVNVYVTSRWLIRPFESIPLNVGGQVYVFNTSLSVAPEISVTLLDHLELAAQMQFGILNDPRYLPRASVRAWF